MVEDSPTSTYTLKRRLTSNQLCEYAAKKILVAQETYPNSVKEAVDDLWYNNQMCRKIDTAFGTNYEDDGEEETTHVVKSRDGSHLQRCVMNACTSSTYKLHRHLRDVHPTLSDEGHVLAVEISRKIERNKSMMHDGSRTSESLEKKPIKKLDASELHLVARKSNYKSCQLCNHLYLNLPDHVFNIHKISRTDPRYDSYIRDPLTIPKCYTKCIDGRTVALEGEVLEAAKVKFGKIVKAQETDLQLRKRLRNEIMQLGDKVKSEEQSEERETMLTKMQELKDQYKCCRYPDTRVYSECVSSWKDGYLDFLKNQKCKDPQRVQRMVMDVFLNYEKDCGKPRTIRNILLHFRDTEDLSNLSKLKYIGQFGSFVEYLLL